MSEEEPENSITITVPIIKTESEVQTEGRLVTKTPDREMKDMESSQDNAGMSIRKRRNLSKNRGQSTRQREKTPEPGRTLAPHEDTTTSDDEDMRPMRNSREIEADNTYEEMKRLVQEQACVKDPVYDLDTDKLMEERVVAANERRRRSISPFAIPEKEDTTKLERKGSFIDPSTKLLSTNYIVSPKDEEPTRRSSLASETPKESRQSLSPLPMSGSPKDKDFPYSLPSTPKKLDEIVYSDKNKSESVSKKPRTPLKSENVFTFDEKDTKQMKAVAKSSSSSEITTPSGELVTKVIQIERSPSRKLQTDKKPIVEVRERIVRTPSRKLTAENKPTVVKQAHRPSRDEPQSRVPPVKPARSKSASRFGNKTSESEMSEVDQAMQNNMIAASKRKVTATPRRFVKHSPRANRSQSMHRPEELKVVDRAGGDMSKTSHEIIELMQKARARSLSIPKDDPRLPPEYKDYHRNLKTPNKTPSTTPRNFRGISCPKTIQIISDSEILSGLKPEAKVDIEQGKHSRQSSGYIDASQSEYTSSCYSSSPSENEYDFDLSERTAELTRKLNILSQEVDKRETIDSTILASDNNGMEKQEPKSVLRKRSLVDAKASSRKDSKDSVEENKVRRKTSKEKIKKLTKSRWKIIANWQQFKMEQKKYYERTIMLRNRCICDLMLLIIMCGLGGMMFKALEGSFENAYKCGTRNVKRDFIESLWRGSHYLREEDWKSMARKKLFEFENQLHTAHEAGVTSYSGQRSWNFMNSFVYCLTLITTIGYGHIAPKTTYGRVATIVYAIVGIPLFLIVLADFGKLFTRIIKFFWAFIRRFYYTRSCRKVRRTVPVQEVMKGLNIVYDVVRRPSQIFSEEDVMPDHPPPVQRRPSDLPPPLPPKPGSARDPENDTEPDTPAPSVFEIDDEFNLPISVAIFILVVYIIIGAVAYNLWETWSFFESFYFVFISMSTIGLGDLVPDHPMFMMASILYLVFGLALTSMCINVVQVKLSDTFKQASAKLGATIGLKVAEEDGSLVPITPPPVEIVPVHKPKIDTGDSKSKEDNQNDAKNR
ncbi:hypothetical protein O3G_MSEX006302 [Manduca sexta]|uniref:Potassium channel domain-containing protein n=1 Tax=Manduca sexta TaxID=7130 RepID=A0A921Z1X5_MANSE|nr:hypothetical protein O3G_MSEX006302 [Manduca sexta]